MHGKSVMRSSASLMQVHGSRVPGIRLYSSKKDKGGLKKGEEAKDELKEKKKEEEIKKEVVEDAPKALVQEVEDEDVIDISDFPASFEKAVVKATVPEFVPELIAIPIDRRPVFPGFYKTFTVNDPKVAAALTKALKRGKPYVGLFLSKKEGDETIQEPLEGEAEGPRVDEHSKDTIDDLSEVHTVGTFAQLVNVIPGPEDGVTAIVFPHRRIRALEVLEASNGVSRVRVENIPLKPYARHSQILQALMQEVFVMLTEVAKLNPFFREHITHHNIRASTFEEPSKLADFCAVLTSGQAGELQEVLETDEAEERLRKALVLLKKELISAELQSSIRKDVEAKMSKKQREYLLHEQLKSIKKELGLESDTKEKLTETFRQRATALALPAEVKRVFDELSVLEPAGAEFNLTRNYLDWLTTLPWGRFSKDSYDLAQAASVLDADHYGLQEVKDRILEFIAVAQLKGAVSGKILCLVGPPGVGKTSIGRSIARAIGREYFRLSVGGLSDVAEIKGHRRTYVGAMPGKAVQALKKTQTQNPLILIDEIDKLGRAGHQGDPSAALLELLDPEQNISFLDHYLDVPMDLSKVLFVCTANTTDTIPGPLLDRMEVVRLAGYVAEEKMEIARRHLVPQARTAAGMTPEQVNVTDAALQELIKHYCREAGVRSLRQHLERLYRKAALRLVREQNTSSDPSEEVSPQSSQLGIDTADLKGYVGSPIFHAETLYTGELLPPGVVTGLAWTTMGGSILYMETLLERTISGAGDKPTSGSLLRTGQLGKVMEESSSIAYSYAKAFMTQYHPESAFFQHAAIHLHVPEGATPKDGPSAGTTMATALISLALNKPIRSDIAMTGELSLTGKILRIGGVKEKMIAARRAGVKTIILPSTNRADWDDLPAYIKEGLDVHFVGTFPDIAKIVGLLPAGQE